jgi:hypothetical protein
MNHECAKTKAAVINGKYVTGCSLCIRTTQGSSLYAAKYNRDRSRENHRADIVQRYDGDRINKEWVKLYEQKARDEFGDDKVNDILRGNTNGRNA